MTDTEKDIERYFTKRVKEVGGRAMKFVSPGVVGVPDRLVLWTNGMTDFVELKKKHGRVGTRQKREIESLQDRGFECFVLWSRADVDWYTDYAGRRLRFFEVERG